MSVKPIFFALDGKSLSEFEFELKILKDHIYGVKVGLELFVSEGPSVVEKLKKQGWQVFLDLKLHDIPNTIKEATRSAANLGADFLTIHIASTSDALIEASNTKGNTLQILGVSSALTSRALSNSVSEEVNKELEPGSQYEKYDSDGDGIVTDDELKTTERLQALEIANEKAEGGLNLKSCLALSVRAPIFEGVFL